jgi:hypothetical protein
MDPDYCPICSGDMTLHVPGPAGLVSCPVCGGLVWNAGDEGPADPRLEVPPGVRTRVLAALQEWLSDEQLRVAEQLLAGRARVEVAAECGMPHRNVRRIEERVRAVIAGLSDG